MEERLAAPSRAPAYELWVEMTTRSALRDRHAPPGQEEATASSIVALFKTTRDLMSKHWEAQRFIALAEVVLETVGPFTARWRSMQDSKAGSVGPALRRQFGEELRQLEPKLTQLADLLKEMSEKGDCASLPQRPSPAKPTLGADVPAGIEVSHGMWSLPTTTSDVGALAAMDAFALMNSAERLHVATRRGQILNKDEPLLNAAGLALSGGGIRSATFCLGVVQVLAEAKLLPKFDYLSTVSGGGYLGAFLSNQFDAQDVAHEKAAREARLPAKGRDGADSENAAAQAKTNAERTAADASVAYEKIFASGAADSASVRHLRNNSRYLLPTTTLARLKLLGLLISGVIATTLLALAVPVSCAWVVHWLGRLGLLHGMETGGRTIFVFWAIAGAAAGTAALCWLLRPITAIWRSLREGLDTTAAYACVITAGASIVAATPWALASLEAVRHWQLASVSIASLATLLSGSFVVKAISAAWRFRKALSRLFILSGGLLFVIAYLATIEVLGVTQADASAATEIVGIALVVWLFWALSVNLNLTGLHRYYRDRLASCYLKPPAQERGIAHPPPLENLSAKLPYHLINTTVNLTSSDNPELRGRGGDFFLLSKEFCGSTITGFQKTSDISRMNADFDLATAIAISGAAASTNMGWHTMREYRVLMAIFNVRLGYWMRWRPKRWLGSNAFVQLTRETFGLLSEHASTINLSDGGHIENLGAYELIRRKLKFIVCVDGGMDAGMNCADLNRLQRLVAIDFGYRIDFDTSDLRLVDNFSCNYGMLVKIDYTPQTLDVSEKELGWMLYIKLAMLGTESNYILDYRRENPLFPHQSTADQFFDEAQFEAYRKLGETAARTFLDTRADGTGVKDIREWFQELACILVRDTDPVYQASFRPPAISLVNVGA